jgi:hypothetical protein
MYNEKNIDFKAPLTLVHVTSSNRVASAEVGELLKIEELRLERKEQRETEAPHFTAFHSFLSL